MAIIFLKADIFNNVETRDVQELHCGRLATAHGCDIQRTIIADRADPIPWTLKEAVGLGYRVLITFSLAHIDFRAPEILERCGLLVGHPYGWYHRGHTGSIAGMSMVRTRH
ncbi:hypothetical protein OHA40_02215 [Nocardia sp. NBC_00508]|uniref:hypothetical protein n=1 Tax=Nocardia sp. NBC_00508 TaxID=2975992 RepID=UPI002E8229A1|nr:hypothetical protein [Nocardia sp. NBC_00508]WUD66998.1 hypothetical protein OHA40_02215 [Nocardia sp. NBC_00508]